MLMAISADHSYNLLYAIEYILLIFFDKTLSSILIIIPGNLWDTVGVFFVLKLFDWMIVEVLESSFILEIR